MSSVSKYKYIYSGWMNTWTEAIHCSWEICTICTCLLISVQKEKKNTGKLERWEKNILQNCFLSNVKMFMFGSHCCVKTVFLNFLKLLIIHVYYISKEINGCLQQQQRRLKDQRLKESFLNHLTMKWQKQDVA